MKIKIVLVLVFISIILLLVPYNLAMVRGDSMSPTLHDFQVVVLTSSTECLQLNDIVVFNREGYSSDDFIKRITAVEGDTIYYNTEPYPSYSHTSISPTSQEIIIPKGYYFLEGDNEDESIDSRNSAVGLVNIDEIIGKVVMY